MTDSDHELMRRLQSGDVIAFEELVGRWQAPLARILRRLAGTEGNGHPDAGPDDLAQEVFLRVYQSRKRYQPTAEFSTWLYRIAINTSRDAQRRRKRRPSVSLNGVSHNGKEPAAETKSAAAEMIARNGERRAMIAKALKQLPDKLREPLVLRHYTELSFPQIADVLNTPCTTIKSRVHLALKQLETELRQLGFDESELES